MRFFEQICSGRIVISNLIIADACSDDRVTRDVDAACWIEAKKSLGYGLSAVQEYLLEAFYARHDQT